MNKGHVFPFFWQKGCTPDIITDELYKIHETGVTSLCIESRTHPKFCEKEWFDDMRLIFSECRKLGMTCWILDDKRFPTGYANGALEHNRELEKTAVSEKHTDIMGPVSDCAVIVSDRLPKEASLLCVLACERVVAHESHELTGRVFDITDKVSDGIAFFDLPEGLWRITVFYTFPIHDNYIDTTRQDSAALLIKNVYEPHFRELEEYFGNTFLGFFSDEPFILREASLPIGNESRPGGWLPWNDNIKNGLRSSLGNDYLTSLPSLWYPSENMAQVRIAYMNTVTRLYDKCFGTQMGDWCRNHGIEYIGHIVEDEGYHCRFWISAGHYFRSLDGQDMAGIDIVSDALLPGLEDTCHAVGSSFGHNNGEFFTFGLAKLASSHSHIQQRKHGRAMCEIFGNFGWGEGIPLMKWLTDIMLVRGINRFVPHAFSPDFPDADCPPHFYARGNYTQYRAFSSLMNYTERVSSMLDGGRHFSTCAVLYHAEAEWSGGKYMPFERVAKYLTRGQLDFDVIPEDYLATASVENGKLKLCLEDYPVFIVPYTEIIDDTILSDLYRISSDGVKVVFVDEYPSRTVNGSPVMTNRFCTVPLDELTRLLSSTVTPDIIADGSNTDCLRYYHCLKDNIHFYFFTNEGIKGDVSATVNFPNLNGFSEYVEYSPLDEKAIRHAFDGKSASVNIPVYGSVMLIFGNCNAAGICPAECSADDMPAVMPPHEWTVAFAAPKEYDPLDFPDYGFDGEKTVAGLYNIARENPRFSGFVRYSTKLDLSAGNYSIDFENVGETAYLWVNGKPCGERIVPPYRFDFTASEGINSIDVVTTSHLGYRMRDKYSAFYNLGTIGITGNITLRKYKSTPHN